MSKLPFLVELPAGSGLPNIPVFDDMPTPAPQVGEKLELASDAFTISEATPEVIDSAIYLNISAQLERDHAGVVETFMGYAVAADAEAQLAAALEAAGTVAATLAAGLAAFDAGLWRPNLLIVAPGSLLDVAPYTSVLEAVGIEIVAVPGVTVGVLADRTAVNGWLSPIAVVATEPSLLGKSVARAIFGRVGATAAGVQVLTAIAA